MRKWGVILLGLGLLMPVVALGQHSSKAAEATPTSAKSAKKAVSLNGLLSADRKTLVSEENDVWSVSNPEALAGLEGKQLVVKCQLFAEKNEIHVFAAKVATAILKNASYKGDSAFRR